MALMQKSKPLVRYAPADARAASIPVDAAGTGRGGGGATGRPDQAAGDVRGKGGRCAANPDGGITAALVALAAVVRPASAAERAPALKGTFSN